MSAWSRWPLLAAALGILLAGSLAQWWLARTAADIGSDPLMLAAARLAVSGTAVAGLAAVALLGWMADQRRGATEAEAQRMRSQAVAQGEQAADQRRLALLGTLAAGLAHELGQPLSAARVGIEGIHYLRQLGRTPSPEQVERTLSRVGMNILAMTQTIDHLRGLAGPHDPAAVAAIDLVACVDTVLAQRDQWLRYSDTRIAWERPAGPVPALGDAAGVRLILTNLLRNAVEAVSGQGEERRLVRVVAGPGPALAVHDSGPGIAPEHLARLFDPFFTTKGPGVRGIGLGLAKASAEGMGARLTVASDLGAGSTFLLRLRDSP